MHIFRTALVSIFFALLLALQVCSSQALAQSPADTAVSDAQVVLIQFAPDTPEAQRLARIAAVGGTLLHWMPQIHVAEVRLPAPGAEASAAGLTPLAAPEISYVEPDLPVQGVGLPTDPAFSSAATSYAYTRIAAPDAWTITTGSDQVTIAVLDSGIKLDHPELAGQVVSGYDFINDDTQADDDSGHGTHVAGLIGAAINNGQGIAGVCPNCRLMPVKVLNADDAGSWSNLARGILFAVDNGADIINLSLGSLYASQTLAAAVDYARQRDVVLVAAAGNHSVAQPFYPAALEGVIAVGATTVQDGWWTLSNSGSFIDLAAPGDLLYSTYYQFDNTYGGYTFMSGTSMAAPLVSGLAGLVLSLDPHLNAAGVTAAMAAGADDLGAPGHDAYFGSGRINAYSTLALLAETRPTAHAEPGFYLYRPSVQNQ